MHSLDCDIYNVDHISSTLHTLASYLSAPAHLRPADAVKCDRPLHSAIRVRYASDSRRAEQSRTLSCRGCAIGFLDFRHRDRSARRILLPRGKNLTSCFGDEKSVFYTKMLVRSDLVKTPALWEDLPN